MSSYSQQYISAVRNKLESLGLVTKSSWRYQKYTLEHKIAFVDTFIILRNHLTSAALSHDTDKLVLYGVMEKSAASRLHRDFSNHHIFNCKEPEHYINCIIDYECARFTKKDKPLNAYDTIMKYCPDQYDNLKPYLQQLGIDSKDTKEFSKIADIHGFAAFRVGEFLDDRFVKQLTERTIKDIDDVYSLYMKHGASKALKIWTSSIDWSN